LGKSQLSNDSWKKRIHTFHWLRPRGGKRAVWKKFFEVQQAIFDLIFR